MTIELNYSQGAARQSWHRDSMRELLRALIEEHPKATDAELLDKFTQLMREDEKYLIAAAEYAVTNTLNVLERHRRQKGRRGALREEEQNRKETETIKEAIRSQVVLLNLEMPTGQRARYTTGVEHGKIGRGYIRVEKKVGTKRVGEVLSEDQYRKLVLGNRT